MVIGASSVAAASSFTVCPPLRFSSARTSVFVVFMLSVDRGNISHHQSQYTDSTSARQYIYQLFTYVIVITLTQEKIVRYHTDASSAGNVYW